MKKVLFMLAFIATLLVGSMSTAGAQVNYTVYDGTTTNSYVPVYGLYTDSYLKCEYVIPATDLTAINGSNISALTYHLSSAPSAAWTCNFQVFVKEVTSSSISSFSGIDDATIVYEGTLDATSGTMVVNFTTPYQYNGGNLLIGFYNTNTGNYKSASFYGQAITNSSVQGHHGSNPSSITANQRNFIPKTTFTVDELHGCITPTQLAVSDVATYGATVTWTPGYQETSWVVKFNDLEFPTTTPSYTATTLDPNTTYVASVKAVCSATEESEYTTPGVSFTTLPTCPTPSAVTFSDITATSVTVAWTNGGSETAWTIDANGTEYTANSNPFTLTGLTPATSYTVKVKANCSATDESDWSTTATFETPCVAVVVTETEPFTEDFNTLTTGIPSCWDNAEGTTTDNSYKWNYFATGVTGACVRFNSYSNSSNNTNYLKTPQLDLSGLTNPMVSFSYKNPTGGDFSVYYTIDGTNYVEIATGLTGVSSWTNVEYTIADLAGATNAYIIFKGTSNWGSGDAYIYLDDVLVSQVPTCPKPTDVTVNDITTTSAEISWTNGGTETAWTISYNGTEVAANSNPFTLTGLTPATVYTVMVKANCSAEDESYWSTAAEFVTECGTFNVTESTPYQESFDGTAFPPTCWSRAHTAGSSSSQWIRTTSSSNIHTGAGAAQLQDQSTGNRNDLVTGVLNIPAANQYQVTMWMYRSTYSYSIKPNEGVKVWINTTPDTTGATEIGYIHREYTLAPAETATGWYEYSFVIPNAGDMYVIFQGISEYGQASYIDDISVEKAPTCLKPTEVVILDSLTTETTAVVDWTPAGDETQWEVACNGDTTLVSAHPFTITGLSASTTYTVSVRAYCSDEDQSYWTSGVNFNTECAAVVVVTFDNPYHEGFEGTICWSTQQIAGEDNWQLTDYSVYEGEYSAYFPYDEGAEGLLISPVFDLTQIANPELSFQYWTRIYSGSCDRLELYYRTAETEEWVLMDTFVTPMSDYDSATYALPTPTATYQIAFKGIGLDAFGLYLDDINITGEEIETPCEVPTNLAVENNVATWESEADNFNVMYIANGDTTTVAVEGNTYTFTGLEDSTLVTVFVQAVCDETTTSDWTEGVEFMYIDTTAVGIANFSNIAVKVYPNPATDVINIECNAINANLSIFDMFGKQVMNTQIQNAKTELNISALAPGVYMIRIANNNEFTTVKVVKK